MQKAVLKSGIISKRCSEEKPCSRSTNQVNENASSPGSPCTEPLIFLHSSTAAKARPQAPQGQHGSFVRCVYGALGASVRLLC